MNKLTVSLSKKDEKFREFALNGNMWMVILYVCLPLAIFQSVNHIFNILDTFMASHISAQAVSAVAYLSQIQNIISAIGSGLAIGSSLKISEAYGAGDYELVKRRLSSLIGMCLGISLLVAAMIPFTQLFLRLTGTPDSFIEIGTRYFSITLFATIISFFNNVYIAIERARGNSKRILYLNTGIILFKLSLTAWFIFRLNADVTMIAVATLAAQLVLFLFAIKNLSEKGDVFSFSYQYVSFTKKIMGPMIGISFPVMVEKVSFAMGKTLVNSMSKSYGELTVGALGISNNINGISSSLQNGFQDGGAAIISQNLGADKPERAIECFQKILVINLLIGLVLWIVLNLWIEPITYLFANSASGFDKEFQQTIIKVFRYDSFGSCVPLGVSSAVVSLLFGFGYTKLTLLINFCRVFVFRVPVLWALQNFTKLGSECVGIVMAVSNISVGIFSAMIAVFVLKNLKCNIIKT